MKDYKKILEGVVSIIDTTEKSDICFANICTYIGENCPELKESEDERIRKKLIEAVKGDMVVGGAKDKQRAIAWLEKQKYALKSFKDEDVRKFMKYIEKQAKAYEFNLPNRSYDIFAFAKDILIWLEKQDEKPQGKSALESRTDKELVEEVYSHLDSIKETADRMTSGNFMHNKAAIKFSANTITKVLELIGIKAQKDSMYDNQNCVKHTDEVEPKFKIGDIVQYITDSTDRRKIEEIDTLCNMYHTDSSPIMFEVEDEWKSVLNSENVEQNLADKVNPKFHKGEWTVSNLDRKARQISEVHFDEYNSYYVVDGKEFNLEEYDRPHHSWTIKDAKDGDVLANDYHILILKELCYDWSSNGTPYSVKAYCGINPNGIFEIGKDDCCFCGTFRIHPATKEQCNLLFTKMKEAGYEWDAEKNELRKVEQNHTNWIDGL